MSIPIKGMHCKSCTVIIADELSKIPGVKHASASLKTNTATIRYTNKPTYSQIERAINAAGYTIDFDDKTFFSKDKSTYATFAYSVVFIVIVILILQQLGFSGFNINGLGNNKAVMALVVG